MVTADSRSPPYNLEAIFEVKWASVEMTTSSGSSSRTLENMKYLVRNQFEKAAKTSVSYFASRFVMAVDLQSLKSGWADRWPADQRPFSRHAQRARPVASKGQGTMATSPLLVQFQLIPRMKMGGHESGTTLMLSSVSTMTSTWGIRSRMKFWNNWIYVMIILTIQSRPAVYLWESFCWDEINNGFVGNGAHLVWNWQKRAKKVLWWGTGLTWQLYKKRGWTGKEISGIEINLGTSSNNFSICK